MVTLKPQLPEEAFGTSRLSPELFVAELRLAAAMRWYQLGIISGSKAAGLSWLLFLEELARRRLDVFKVDLDDLARELGDAN